MSNRIRIRIPSASRSKVERELYENELMEAANAGELLLVGVRPYLAGQFMLIVLQPPVPPVGKIA